MKIGYARVSTGSQSLEVQNDKLQGAGCEKIFKEKASGGNRSRPALENALEYVREGDVLTVTKLDRLARSVIDLGEIVRVLERKAVDLVVLDQKIDTTTASGRLMFHVLAAIAEFERELIRERAADGRARAKANGVRFGAKPKLSVQQIEALRTEFAEPGVSKREIAARYGISRSSAYRLLENNVNNEE